MGEMGDTGKNWEELRETERNLEGWASGEEMGGMGELRGAKRAGRAERNKREWASWPGRNN